VENLKTGRFYGQTNSTIHLDFATITDTEYTHEKVDWHYHDNAYFTFILDGKVIEGNKKEVYNCTAGSLLFHNWQDAHYNIKPKGFTRGFHIELNEGWFNNFKLYRDNLQGSFSVANPDVKFLFYKMAEMQGDSLAVAKRMPLWVGRLKEILNDNTARKFTLSELSAMLQIHPVHLSRDFSKYFNCNLGEYIRKLRVEKAFALLPDSNLSLTDIAHTCGFADQSHFLRSFKNFNQANPTVYRKLLMRAC
jgi:AraC family transcriptional regulator